MNRQHVWYRILHQRKGFVGRLRTHRARAQELLGVGTEGMSFRDFVAAERATCKRRKLRGLWRLRAEVWSGALVAACGDVLCTELSGTWLEEPDRDGVSVPWVRHGEGGSTEAYGPVVDLFVRHERVTLASYLMFQLGKPLGYAWLRSARKVCWA
jgi:hypothetical protein